MRLPRHLRHGLATAAAVATIATAAGSGAAATTPATTVAVLGDSYVSGEGLASAAGPCARSDESWGVTVAGLLGDETPDVVACTGATVADLTVGRDGEPAQLAALQAPVDVAVLVIGGNDLGFADIVAGCLDVELVAPGGQTDLGDDQAWRSTVASGLVQEGCEVDAATIADRLDAFDDGDRFPLSDGSTGDLTAVLETVVAQGVVPGGRLVLVGYPALFQPSAEWPSRYGHRCHGVLAVDADAFADGTDALTAALARAAAEVSGDTDVQVSVVDVGRVASGRAAGPDGDLVPHGLCGGEDPWVHGLTLAPGGLDLTLAAGALLGGGDLDPEALGVRPSASFHPNAAGHVGIAAVVADALGLSSPDDP